MLFFFQFSTSLKVLLDSWNKMTSLWLRYVVYERCHSTFAVFLFSAFWHGFYPGYYLTFLGGAIFIHASRLVGTFGTFLTTRVVLIDQINDFLKSGLSNQNHFEVD